MSSDVANHAKHVMQIWHQATEEGFNTAEFKLRAPAYTGLHKSASPHRIIKHKIGTKSADGTLQNTLESLHQPAIASISTKSGFSRRLEISLDRLGLLSRLYSDCAVFHDRFDAEKQIDITENSQITQQSISVSACSGCVNRCRPLHRADYSARLRSYSAYNWFAKPVLVSAPQCARHGWVNRSVDELFCPCCQASLFFSIDKHESNDSILEAARNFRKRLNSGHRNLCPWKNNQSPVTFMQLRISPGTSILFQTIVRLLHIRELEDCTAQTEGEKPSSSDITLHNSMRHVLDAIEILLSQNTAINGLNGSSESPESSLKFTADQTKTFYRRVCALRDEQQSFNTDLQHRCCSLSESYLKHELKVRNQRYKTNFTATLVFLRYASQILLDLNKDVHLDPAYCQKLAKDVLNTFAFALAPCVDTESSSDNTSTQTAPRNVSYISRTSNDGAAVTFHVTDGATQNEAMNEQAIHGSKTHIANLQSTSPTEQASNSTNLQHSPCNRSLSSDDHPLSIHDLSTSTTLGISSELCKVAAPEIVALFGWDIDTEVAKQHRKDKTRATHSPSLDATLEEKRFPPLICHWCQQRTYIAKVPNNRTSPAIKRSYGGSNFSTPKKSRKNSEGSASISSASSSYLQAAMSAIKAARDATNSISSSSFSNLDNSTSPRLSMSRANHSPASAGVSKTTIMPSNEPATTNSCSTRTTTEASSTFHPVLEHRSFCPWSTRQISNPYLLSLRGSASSEHDEESKCDNTTSLSHTINFKGIESATLAALMALSSATVGIDDVERLSKFTNDQWQRAHRVHSETNTQERNVANDEGDPNTLIQAGSDHNNEWFNTDIQNEIEADVDEDEFNQDEVLMRPSQRLLIQFEQLEKSQRNSGQSGGYDLFDTATTRSRLARRNSTSLFASYLSSCGLCTRDSEADVDLNRLIVQTKRGIFCPGWLSYVLTVRESIVNLASKT